MVVTYKHPLGEDKGSDSMTTERRANKRTKVQLEACFKRHKWLPGKGEDAVRVMDISMSGAQLVTTRTLSAGQEITVIIDSKLKQHGSQPFKARVMWTKDIMTRTGQTQTNAGVKFARLSHAQIELIQALVFQDREIS
jgi:c-di-GMP-binding flagellar brake protein YcgR